MTRVGSSFNRTIAEDAGNSSVQREDPRAKAIAGKATLQGQCSRTKAIALGEGNYLGQRQYPRVKVVAQCKDSVAGETH